MVDIADVLRAQAAELIEELGHVEASVTALADRAERQEHLTTRTRHVLVFALLGLTLDLVLTVFGGYLFVGARQTSDTLSVVQTRTSSQVLCPLYELFVASIRTQPIPPNETPEQTKLREDGKLVILNGYNILRCGGG